MALRNRPASFGYCERLARRTARNFYPAFLVLPHPQRQAMCALYAFLRVSDDLADDAPAVGSDPAVVLARWRQQTIDALAGHYSHPLHPALHATVEHYRLPSRYLFEVLEGVASDLTVVKISTFDQLYTYCYRVASAVGLACIHIWGFDDPAALRHAEHLGIAFQLTNILRDLAEDHQRGRIYLPADELARFGCRLDAVATSDPAFQALMRFQVQRARHYYRAGDCLLRHLTPTGRAILQVMIGTYRGLLDRIEERGYDVFSSRVRLPRWRKIGLLLRAYPVRWGWA